MPKRLSPERRNEISWLLTLRREKRQGLELKPESFARDLGNASKELGVPVEELKLYARELVDAMVSATFGDK